MTKHIYKLYYFSVRSRCEFLRYIFAYANQPYDEIIIDRNEWFSKIKKEMPFGIIPVLELENGVKLSQSLAIGRYLATKFGLMSNDDFENAWGDQIAGAIEDIYSPYWGPWVRAYYEKDDAKIREKWSILENDGFIPLFNRLEKSLGEKTWFCGQNIHWSDLHVAELVDRVETTFHKKELVKKFPKLLAHCRRIHELPGIKKYVENRKPTIR